MTKLFVRSGLAGLTYENDVWLAANATSLQGAHAEYWEQNSTNVLGAYRFVFFGTGIIPSGGSLRYAGTSLRCLYAS